MIKKCLPLLCFLGSGWAAKAALITGAFRNAFSSDRVEVVAPHYYIDGKSDTYQGELDGKLQFSIEVKITEPQLVFLVFNEDRLPIFIEPNDTVSVRADAFKFPLVVSFGARGGANNVVLQKYLQENLQDYNEFNNLRFKIGQWWANVEEPMNRQMEDMEPAAFRDSLDRRKIAAFALLDEFTNHNPDALSPVFRDWLSAEITYYWAYHLLFYGQVYGNMHHVQPEFFDFLYDAPTINDMIGSDWYRQFLLELMARQQAKKGLADNFWAGQYYLAGELLSGKALAFFRSEMINIAFSVERYKEILPLFNDFLQNNHIAGYDEKVADLYQKFAKVSPGTPAPVFAATDVSGKAVSLGQFKGKVVYLNFWASWCGSCIRKMDYLNACAPELNSKGIEIVNVSVDANPDKWREALQERHFHGFNLLASGDGNMNIAAKYGVEAVPQYFIIDRKGAFAEKAYGSKPEDIRLKLLEITK